VKPHRFAHHIAPRQCNQHRVQVKQQGHQRRRRILQRREKTQRLTHVAQPPHEDQRAKRAPLRPWCAVSRHDRHQNGRRECKPDEQQCQGIDADAIRMACKYGHGAEASGGERDQNCGSNPRCHE